MSEAYTIKVYPKGYGRDAYRVLKVPGTFALYDLCMSVLNAFDFYDTMHLYEFQIGQNEYYGPAYGWEGDPDVCTDDPCIGDLGLVPKSRFTLLFDFGDCWLFQFVVQKVAEDPNCTGCSLLKSKGKVDQYPPFDEDDWEEEEDEEEE